MKKNQAREFAQMVRRLWKDELLWNKFGCYGYNLDQLTISFVISDEELTNKFYKSLIALDLISISGHKVYPNIPNCLNFCRVYKKLDRNLYNNLWLLTV